MLTIAAIQLDVKPAPTPQRLERAEIFVGQAAQKGAELVVLPELFNTGYAYTDENYRRAETLLGPTVEWLKSAAQQHNVHLAGSLLLRDAGEIYDSLLLVAPDRRIWRYDKMFPFAWERRYFRSGKGITIAHTDLGDLGLLICIDAAHLQLWRRYAGQVDMMVIASCPPHTGDWTYRFPDGDCFTVDQLGPLMRPMKEKIPLTFTRLLSEQAAWMGAPVVNTVACGTFESPMPDGRRLIWSLLPFAPGLVRFLRQAGKMTVSSPMLEGCRVINSGGKLLAERTQAQGEGFAIASVSLPDEKPQRQGKQPKSPLPFYAVWMSDTVARQNARAYAKKKKL